MLIPTRDKAHYLTVCLIAFFLLNGIVLAQGGPGSLTAELTGPGAGEGGTILAGEPFQFDIILQNLPDFALYGISNGFRVYSPGSASWEPITCDSFSHGWPDRFDYMPFNVYYHSVTGAGADSLVVGAVAQSGSGFEPGFTNEVWYISTEVDPEDAGQFICIDSSFCPPNATWMWSNASGSYLPSWGGPYCYEIEYTPTWTPGDDHKMHFPQLPDDDGWDCDMAYLGANIALADDWQCSETGWVKSIHWWGSWWQGNVGTLDTLYMAIFSDTVGVWDASQPGHLLWMAAMPEVQATLMPDQNPQNWFHSSAGYTYHYDDQAYYQFDLFLDEADWFWQEEGTIYWLVMSTDVDGNGDTALGWRSTDDHWRAPAIWGQLNSSGYWDFGAVLSEPPDWQGPMDFAFVITDTVGGAESCCIPPLRGNVNYDVGDVTDISDLVYLVDFMFTGGPAPVCLAEADVDCSGDIDISDLVYLVDYMFTGGPPLCRCDCADCP